MVKNNFIKNNANKNHSSKWKVVEANQIGLV